MTELASAPPEREERAPPVEAYPWGRFWAKWIDCTAYALMLALVLALIKSSFLDDALWRFYVLFSLTFPLAEAVLISVFGTTLGKVLFRIRITAENGEKLDLNASFKRSISGWLRGSLFGLPVLSLLANWSAYQEYQRDKITPWDKAAGALVVARQPTPLSWALLVASVVGVSAFNVASRTDWSQWSSTGYDTTAATTETTTTDTAAALAADTAAADAAATLPTAASNDPPPPDRAKIETAYTAFSRAYRGRGMAGVAEYVHRCYASAAKTTSFEVVDFCVAFDQFGMELNAAAVSEWQVPSIDYFNRYTVQARQAAALAKLSFDSTANTSRLELVRLLARDRMAEVARAAEARSAAETSTAAAVDDVIQRPSFDCAKAATASDRVICATPTLAALDVELAAEFEAALQRSAAPVDLRAEQRAWLGTRAAVTDAQQLSAMYAERIATLKAAR
ncbi:MAG TPA: RDD family protein [Caulobacteraceae bacterium]